MRWIHIDDMLEMKAGESATAVKTVSSGADYLEDHYPGFPLMPHTLLIESMAQTAGLLVGASTGFGRDVILAKIDSAEFTALTRPGDKLLIHARMEDLREEGAKVACRISRNGEEVARASLVFALLQESDAARLGIRNFVFTSEVLARFKIQRGGGGTVAT